jgi:hypothetical protein
MKLDVFIRSDFLSRLGFLMKGAWNQSAKVHLSDPERINRLLIAACLVANYLILDLGVSAVKDGWQGVIH